ncbi:MAG: calcium-translocating P-type ATPase, PMCA-type [Clostridia bacterium]|nr:calcium-translocating P-type ATPase, PMCA-type [Clostridia bacterium]
MNYHAKSAEDVLKELKSGKNGLSQSEAAARLKKFGGNELTPKAEKSFFGRVIDAVKEPMLMILFVGFLITFGANIGKYIKTGAGDFTECFGILAAVILSVSITLIMEGSSKKAFRALKTVAGGVAVKVVRGGKVCYIPQKEVARGDIILIESGDKIVADGRLIESESLSVDESALTGESRSVKKDAGAVLGTSTHLAERVNCVYSGTFATGGRGAMVATGTGDATEIGRIAGELSADVPRDSPLNQKLAKLGKTVTAVGAACAGVVFVVSLLRLIIGGAVSFDSVSELFISCIVLIIAAVPEGLPTIVAVSLALNMIRLAKEKALIKKMIATETTGAVSVICSDKTGTLTLNRMSVVSVCGSDFCISPEKEYKRALIENFVLNSTAEASVSGGRTEYFGSGTECALLEAAAKRGGTVKSRKEFPTVFREPFSSEKKYMITAVKTPTGVKAFIKGAPEKVLPLCGITPAQRLKLDSAMEAHRKKARRVLCFAHCDLPADTALDRRSVSTLRFIYDGFCALTDPVRPEVKAAVEECKRAGIRVKMLTGDNATTALAVARELKIADGEEQTCLASDLEKMDDESLVKALSKITVIARSTPIIKLRVVKALKQSGEVVAVTGDGINDAPAIRHADVGIAMGKSGSEITKEAADVVLLDDGFGSVVKAVAFGRNVYRNLQRFVLFQLSVNVAALAFITASAILGLPAPFNTLQLLWINVIMDGPPALTLGLEPPPNDLMRLKPVKRDSGIVNKKTIIRILVTGLFTGAVMLWQYAYNFLGAKQEEKAAATFTLFIFFQLFNAFNCRKLGGESVFSGFGKNKIMPWTFAATFTVHVVIVQAAYKPFGVAPMSAALWLKCALTAFSVIAVSEIFKLFYRAAQKRSERDRASESVSKKFTFFGRINKNQSKA